MGARAADAPPRSSPDRYGLSAHRLHALREAESGRFPRTHKFLYGGCRKCKSFIGDKGYDEPMPSADRSRAKV